MSRAWTDYSGQVNGQSSPCFWLSDTRWPSAASNKSCVSAGGVGMQGCKAPFECYENCQKTSGGNHTCWHMCADIFHAYFRFLPHTQITLTHSYTCESKHQWADISHGRHIFALTLLWDTHSPECSEGPLPYIQHASAVREAAAVYLMIRAFQFSETLNEDGSFYCFFCLISLWLPVYLLTLLCEP